MHSIMTKTLDAFVSFATQIEGSLSNKQIDQMQTLCDKCIPLIGEYDKSYYVKILSSILKLLLLCPYSNAEPIYARYNSLLQWSPIKYKLHDKYECIIAALLGIVEQMQTPCFAIDVTVSGLLLGACSELGQEMKSKNKDFLKSIMLIADIIYPQIQCDLNQFGEQGINFADNENVNNNSYLTQRLITLSYSKLRFYSTSSEYSRIMPSNILKVFLGQFQEQNSSPFNSQFYLSIKNNPILTMRSKIYLCLILWISLITNENLSDLLIERQLCEQLKTVLKKESANNKEQKDFMMQLVLSLNLKINLESFADIILQPQCFDIDSSQIFKILYEQIKENNKSEDFSITEIKKTVQKMSTSQITLQNVIDFLTKLFQIFQQQQFKLPQNKIVPSFNELSLILFDKINLKPANRANNLLKDLSFQQKNKDLRIVKSKLLLKYIYQIDSTLKANTFLMNSAPATDSGQKLIVTCLKKYYNTTLGRVNQSTIRCWVQQRNYLLIWSMLLCNYKVKTISEQFIKCGLNSQELRSIFPVEAELTKEYVQFLISKDRIRLRLALWNLNLLHRQYLSECSLPQLLL